MTLKIGLFEYEIYKRSLLNCSESWLLNLCSREMRSSLQDLHSREAGQNKVQKSIQEIAQAAHQAAYQANQEAVMMKIQEALWSNSFKYVWPVFYSKE